MEKERKRIKNSQNGKMDRRSIDFSRCRRRLMRLLRRRKRTVTAAAACALAACCMLLIVWALVSALSGPGEKMQMETVENVEGEPFNVVYPLQENAYPEINDLIGRYYAAMQEGDRETLIALRDNTETTELLRIQENSSHIEAYTDLVCYTKPGADADSFVVFARYEVKFRGSDTTLPGIDPFYVCRNEEGGYYLHDLSQDEAAAAYTNEVAAQEDVTELYAQVNEEYAARLAQDEVLAAYLESYQNDMVVAVGEALEEQTSEAASTQEAENGESASQNESGQEAGTGENGSEEGGEDGNEEEAASSSGGQDSPSVPDSGDFTVSDTLNIRRGASETSDRIGTCYPGETLEILMKQADGWTRVRYQGQTGYVRSDVLK